MSKREAFQERISCMQLSMVRIKFINKFALFISLNKFALFESQA